MKPEALLMEMGRRLQAARKARSLSLTETSERASVSSRYLRMAEAGQANMSLLKLAEWLGPKRPRAIKASAYESGMDPVGTARERYSVKFYLVGMIFIVFDVEIVFMYPWAVS